MSERNDAASRTMKIGVIGAGAVGAACLLATVMRGCAREIVVVNRDRKRAKGVVTDLRYGASLSPVVDIADGDYADLSGVALVMITAGVNEQAGGATDRESLVKELLRAFERRYDVFTAASGKPESVLPAYREVCDTIGREVEVQLPDGASARGTAVTVDDGGMLVVRAADGVERAWSAGDVVHVRAEG